MSESLKKSQQLPQKDFHLDESSPLQDDFHMPMPHQRIPEVLCVYHDQLITNFCVQTLMPLCPICVEIQTEKNSQLRLPQQIQSLVHIFDQVRQDIEHNLEESDRRLQKLQATEELCQENEQNVLEQFEELKITMQQWIEQQVEASKQNWIQSREKLNTQFQATFTGFHKDISDVYKKYDQQIQDLYNPGSSMAVLIKNVKNPKRQETQILYQSCDNNLAQICDCLYNLEQNQHYLSSISPDMQKYAYEKKYYKKIEVPQQPQQPQKPYNLVQLSQMPGKNQYLQQVPDNLVHLSQNQSLHNQTYQYPGQNNQNQNISINNIPYNTSQNLSRAPHQQNTYDQTPKFNPPQHRFQPQNQNQQHQQYQQQNYQGYNNIHNFIRQ